MWHTTKKAYVRGCVLSISLLLNLSKVDPQIFGGQLSSERWPGLKEAVSISPAYDRSELPKPTQEAPINPTHRETLPIVLVGNIRGRDLIAFVCGIPDVSCYGPVFNWRQEKEEEYEVIDRLPTYTGSQRNPEQSKAEPESADHCWDSLVVRGWAWLLS